MKNFCIAGGGTSGWVTAAILKSIYPDSTVTIIESSKYGTIGVGESTTPAILDFLNLTNIDFVDFIKKTESTIKIGIKFENWVRQDEHYLHTFELIKNPTLGGINWGVDYLKDFQKDQHTYDHMLTHNLVPITQDGKPTGTHALHINALKLVDYLRDFLKDRVTIKDDAIKEVRLNANGVQDLLLESGTVETADIFFDCTGFTRVIHKELGSKWKSLKDILPVDSAIPAPFDWKSPMNTTHASALTSGWVWQVPLQTRVGSGYVFSSAHCKDPEAEFKTFIKKKYDREIDPSRIIKFETGYVENPWNKNVVCIGLSSGFVEPLESTSIHMMIHQVLGFSQHYDGIVSSKVSNLYNNYMCDMFEDTAAFVKLHYLATPHQNDFWRDVSSNINHRRLEYLLDIWKEHVPTADHIGQNKNQTVGYRIFAIAAWIQVLQGMERLRKPALSRFIRFNQIPDMPKNFSNLISQRDFLTKINMI